MLKDLIRDCDANFKEKQKKNECVEQNSNCNDQRLSKLLEY